VEEDEGTEIIRAEAQDMSVDDLAVERASGGSQVQS
jgi:hypothetical protein